MKYLINGISIFIVGFIISFISIGIADPISPVRHVLMAVTTSLIASCTVLILRKLDSIIKN